MMNRGQKKPYDEQALCRFMGTIMYCLAFAMLDVYKRQIWQFLCYNGRSELAAATLGTDAYAYDCLLYTSLCGRRRRLLLSFHRAMRRLYLRGRVFDDRIGRRKLPGDFFP